MEYNCGYCKGGCVYTCSGRSKCQRVGEEGHTNCGWCEEHKKPRFFCGCRVSHKPPMTEEAEGIDV
jgi:hypothetical protein